MKQRERKEQKRQEALDRHIQYESLTTAEKLARLNKYGFRALKERAKLAKAQ